MDSNKPGTQHSCHHNGSPRSVQPRANRTTLQLLYQDQEQAIAKRKAKNLTSRGIEAVLQKRNWSFHMHAETTRLQETERFAGSAPRSSVPSES